MRRTPMKRTGWKSRSKAAAAPASRAQLAMKTIAPATRRGTYAGTTAGPAPKTEAARNPHLLAMARGMPCLLRVPGVCTGGRSTTVACHSNLGIHGKAGARKADDQFTAWGCAACHSWLDQGPASAAEKAQAFMAAHLRQVEAWRGIAAYDPFLKDKAAAQWALDRLNATPVGKENQ